MNLNDKKKKTVKSANYKKTKKKTAKAVVVYDIKGGYCTQYTQDTYWHFPPFVFPAPTETLNP